MAFKEYIGSLQTSLLSILGPTLPYKTNLQDLKNGINVQQLTSDVVPGGEIWEVNNIFGQTSAAAENMYFYVVRADATEMTIRVKANVQMMDWQGSIFLEEGQTIRVFHANIGNMFSYVLGTKRYSPQALEELLHKTRSIPIKEDVQQPGPKPDPRM